jgi:hypothetical protein
VTAFATLLHREADWHAALNVPLVNVRRPIRPNVSTAVAAFGASHLRPERADHRIVGQMICAHGRAVAAIDRAAIDQNVPATVASDIWPSVTGANASRLALFL